MARIRTLAISIAVALILVVAAGPAIAEPTGPGRGERSNGLTVKGVETLTERTTAYTVATKKLRQPVDIIVTVPDDYDPARRYPVLYLMHGTSGRATDWVLLGDAEQATNGRDLIVVAPDAGYDGDGGGWYVNWWNNGRGGVPMWEDFHVDQVVGWVDTNFSTIAARDGRAIAGASQGGFGAMHAAARHPDVFSSVGTFSGAPEIFRDPHTRLYASTIIEGTTLLLNGATPGAMFGPTLTNRIRWQGHDPGYLIENLRHTQIEMWVGDGTSGDLDDLSSCCTIAGNLIEHATHTSTHAFARHLREAGVDFELRSRKGTHSWVYWKRDLAEYVDILSASSQRPTRSVPRRITYTAIDESYTAWGWKVDWQRDGREEFTTLSNADDSGFTLHGAGPVTVRTAPAFEAGRAYDVTVTTGGETKRKVRRADDQGRLAIRTEVTTRADVTIDPSSVRTR